MNTIEHSNAVRLHSEPNDVSDTRHMQSERDRYIMALVRRKFGREFADKISSHPVGAGVPVYRRITGESR